MLEIKRKPNNIAGSGAAAPSANRPQSIGPSATARAASEQKDFHARRPVITGEAHCRGTLPVDGLLSGLLGGNGASLSVRQKSKSFFRSEPELSGEISFRDMLRVNGHIAGTVYSEKGTLIVDANARVDASVDVAVAVIGGIVNGDIVAHERVEVGPAAKIYGNIWTRSIAIKSGAIFEGACRMIEDELATGQLPVESKLVHFGS